MHQLRNADQLPEKGSFVETAKTVEHMRVFTDRQMRKQRDFFTHSGQIVEGTHRYIDFIADALTIDQQLWWTLLQQDTLYATNHEIYGKNELNDFYITG